MYRLPSDAQAQATSQATTYIYCTVYKVTSSCGQATTFTRCLRRPHIYIYIYRQPNPSAHYSLFLMLFPAMSSCHVRVQVLDPGKGVPHLGTALHPAVVRPLSGGILSTNAHMFPHRFFDLVGLTTMRTEEGLSRLWLSGPMLHLFMSLQDLETRVLSVAGSTGMLPTLLTCRLMLP